MDEIKFSFGSNGFEFQGPPVLIVTVSVILIISLIWLFGDAKKRNKNPLLAIIFVTFSAWPLSILWWLWLRPELEIKD